MDIYVAVVVKKCMIVSNASINTMLCCFSFPLFATNMTTSGVCLPASVCLPGMLLLPGVGCATTWPAATKS